MPGFGREALALHPCLFGDIAQRPHPHETVLARLARLDDLAHDHLQRRLGVQWQVAHERLRGSLLAGTDQEERLGVQQALAHGYLAPQSPAPARAQWQFAPIFAP
ncbi:hypothetical protein D3C71_1387030 [compost metagenome]